MENKYTCFINAKLYTPSGVIENGRLLVSADGQIEAVGGPEMQFDKDVAIRDVSGYMLLPGFIDVHIHGGNGFNVMHGTYESIDGISRFHAAHGTTSFLATTGTASAEQITRALKSSADAIKRGVSGAEVIGIHLEGPFIDIKRRGAQNKNEIRIPTPEEIEHFVKASEYQIKLVTLAPEVEWGIEAVKLFVAMGITVSAGHSDATYEQVVEAVQNGVNHTTHHFNGMSPLHHREPGLAGAGLMLPQLTTEVIVDGIHVHPAAVKLLFDVKSEWNVCMITDAVTCAGLPDGDYGHVTMNNGQIYLKDGSTLAGSSLTTIQALKNAIRFTGYPIEKILPSLTQVPARQIRMDHRKGALEPGKDADFLIVDQELDIMSTYVKGKEVYRSDADR